MSSFLWQDEVLKALLNISVSLVTLAFTWLVGLKLTNYWALQQKWKELDLTTVHEFYNLYGEFFAVWKLWSYCKKYPSAHTSDRETRWKLLERASAAEATLEAIFVKLASEKKLSQDNIETLGKFRQAYQTLRQSIKQDKDLDWQGSNAPQYISFKRLAYQTACIIVPDKSRKQQDQILVDITDNKWENQWVFTDDELKRLETHAKR